MALVIQRVSLLVILCCHAQLVMSFKSASSNIADKLNVTETANSNTHQESILDLVSVGSFFAKSHQRERQQEQQINVEQDQDEHIEGVQKVIRDLVKERHQSELPELTSSHNPNDEIQLKAVENFFFRSEEMQDVYSISDYGLMALVARAQAVVYGDLYTHGYDTHADMRQAAGPSVDNELCIKQLEHLVNRTHRQEVEKYRSKDLNLYRLMDTWGRIPPGLLLGNVFFAGMYDECLKLKLKMPDGEDDASSRYCVLRIKHVDWPKIDKHDVLSLKAGICIPKSCDSTNYKNKLELIMNMSTYLMRPIDIGQNKITSLYCLPDEDSPMRSLIHHPKSMFILACLALWFLLLLYSTWKHHLFTSSQSTTNNDNINELAVRKGYGLTNMSVGRKASIKDNLVDLKDSPEATQQVVVDQAPPQVAQNHAKIYELLSITNNLRLLFDTTKESSLMETGRRLNSASNGNSSDDKPTTTTRKCVDLRCIEGIKVIAMIYVIMGHVLMCLTTLTANAKELAQTGSTAFFVANLVPAFAVNAFFTITGTLTCYLMFKQHQTYSFITSPGKWFAFILYRYLRIMPMYALAVLYCKHLAKFTSSGPLWDYATSSLGQRRTCEQEPWYWTLTFTSNFMPPMRHCIPGGWYLSNDFQFFLVTPIFLAALYKRPKFGQALLYTGIVAGYLTSFYSIFGSQVDDLRPIANFAMHGFKTYVSHFSDNYTQPQYRIPAYLIGLLIGHKLYQYEMNNLFLQAEADKDESIVVQQQVGWSKAFTRFATPVCVFLVALCCVTPVIGSKLTFTKWGAKFLVALFTPTYHVLFALAVGILLLITTTGHGVQRMNNFLAAPQWKPLARLSLCAVLVNVETINYFVQSNTTQHFVSSQIHVAMNCLCILATYFIATLVCVLFEAPIRGALNAILTLAITKVAAKNKKSSSSSMSVVEQDHQNKVKIN